MKELLSAKEYLSQLEMIDVQINQDIERLEEMKQSAASIGSFDYTRDRVQKTTTGDKLCLDVAKYIDLNDKINREIDQFIDAKEQIIKEIRELRNANYVRVLYKVYVQFKSIKEVSYEMKKSYNGTVEIHCKALKAFSELHKELYYLL